MEENNKELQTKGAMENAEKKESVKKEPAKRKVTINYLIRLGGSGSFCNLLQMCL